MDKYRLTCMLRRNEDYTISGPHIFEDRHPDLCKQQIEKAFPGFTALKIKIDPINSSEKSWYTKPVGIDMAKTWKKELAR